MPATLLSRPRAEATSDSAFLARLRQSIHHACDWLVEVAQLRENIPDANTPHPGYVYQNWHGAIRSEYFAATRKWGFFCPYWHSAQAAKALLSANALFGKSNWLAGAEAIGGFLLRNRITERGDFGLPLAFEDLAHVVNTSAVLESLDGLFALSSATGDSAYEEAAIDALHWVARKAYLDGKGVFYDFYDPSLEKFIALGKYRPLYAKLEKNRPLLDDAVFLKGYHRAGNARFLEIFLQTAEHLLTMERPAGNWITYGPCNESENYIHPRHAYWWGGPMIDAWQETGDERFRAAGLRSVAWYSKAMRRDGGFIRNTSLDFNTDSFDHATSGSACAAILFLRAATECGESRYLPLAKKALEFCMQVQFINPEDKNLKGAILEKVLPPSGHDASPYHIRDLGAIFFIQAATAFIQAVGQDIR